MPSAADLLAPHLHPGEAIVVQRAVAPAGAMGAQLGEAFAGPVGSFLAGRYEGMAHGVAPAVPVGTELLVFTDRRLCFLSTTRLGRPKAVLAVCDLSDIAAVRFRAARTAFGKVEIDHRDGATVVLDLKSDRGIDRLQETVDSLL